MPHRFRRSAIFAAALSMYAGAAHADTSVKIATVTAQVNSVASLSLGANSISFPSSDPATVPSIPATENASTISVSARTSALGVVLLTVLATDDLRSGTDVIPINNVTWSATGTGLQNGTLNKVSAQNVGSWTGPGTHNGSLNYFLANSFNYVNGSYSTTITYTLLAP